MIGISSAQYGVTSQYRRYARVVILLFELDDFIELLLMHMAGLEHGYERQACVYRAS